MLLTTTALHLARGAPHRLVGSHSRPCREVFSAGWRLDIASLSKTKFRRGASHINAAAGRIALRANADRRAPSIIWSEGAALGLRRWARRRTAQSADQFATAWQPASRRYRSIQAATLVCPRQSLQRQDSGHRFHTPRASERSLSSN